MPLRRVTPQTIAQELIDLDPLPPAGGVDQGEAVAAAHKQWPQLLGTSKLVSAKVVRRDGYKTSNGWVWALVFSGSIGHVACSPVAIQGRLTSGPICPAPTRTAMALVDYLSGDAFAMTIPAPALGAP